jgi:hypothetical protein
MPNKYLQDLDPLSVPLVDTDIIHVVVEELGNPADKKGTILDFKNAISGIDRIGPINGDIVNVGIAATCAANALTIALKQLDGVTNPAAGDGKCRISFRSSILDTGASLMVDAIAPLSTVISSGSTAGLSSGVAGEIFIYAINNAGAIELAWISGCSLNENVLYSTTAEGGAGGADSKFVLYSTTARTGVAIRLIGKIVIQEATAGTWATNPSNIKTAPIYNNPGVWKPYPAGVYPFPSGNQTVTEGFMPVGAKSGVAPVFNAGATKEGLYKDNGNKTIGIKCDIYQGAVGVSDGTDIYLLSLPIGYQFDLTKLKLNTQIRNGSNLGFFNIFGLADANYIMQGKAVPVSATTFALTGLYAVSNYAQWGASYLRPSIFSELTVSFIIDNIPVL